MFAMSSQIDRTLVLIEAGAFLLDMSQEPEVPEELRRQAQKIAERFPSLKEVLRASSSEFGYLQLGPVGALDELKAPNFSGYLTEEKQNAWSELKQKLALSVEEKARLSQDFLTSVEMQRALRIDEAALHQRVELKWFLGVPGTDGLLGYPRFQLPNGRPIDAVAEIFSLFERHADGWDDPWLIVAWFHRSNERLKNRTPAEMLAIDAEEAIDAAAADLLLTRLE